VTENEEERKGERGGLLQVLNRGTFSIRNGTGSTESIKQQSWEPQQKKKRKGRERLLVFNDFDADLGQSKRGSSTRTEEGGGGGRKRKRKGGGDCCSLPVVAIVKLKSFFPALKGTGKLVVRGGKEGRGKEEGE